MEKDINGNRNTLNNYPFIGYIGAIYNLALWNRSGVNKDGLCTLCISQDHATYENVFPLKIQKCQDLQIQLKYNAKELCVCYYTLSVYSLHLDVKNCVMTALSIAVLYRTKLHLFLGAQLSLGEY